LGKHFRLPQDEEILTFLIGKGWGFGGEGAEFFLRTLPFWEEEKKLLTAEGAEENPRGGRGEEKLIRARQRAAEMQNLSGCSDEGKRCKIRG
jgi:hypothetical protein